MNRSPIVIPQMSMSIPLVYGHFNIVSPGWSYHDHHHSSFEWLYCLEGNVIEWVKDEPYRLKKGEWLLLKPGVRHSTMNNSEQDFAYVSIIFETDNPELRHLLWSTPFIHLTAQFVDYKKFQDISALLQDWLSIEDVEPSFDRQMEFVILIMRLTMEWIKVRVRFDHSYNSDTKPNLRSVAIKEWKAEFKFSANEAKLAHDVARLLESLKTEALHIQDLADHFHVSRNHLSRIFAKIHGMSPRQYLSLLKMKMAKELLIHTSMSVEGIAVELGYTSLSHFSRQFKRWTGQSPLQFRPSLFR